MNPLTLAFFTGLLGSVHCLGMCGPLAFSVPSAHAGSWRLLLDKTLYQVGRMISYSVLGLLVGLLGRQLWMAGFQRGISLFSGLFIAAIALSQLFRVQLFTGFVTTPVSRLLNYALRRKAGHLVIGMLNGLLPCGFVTLALAGALTEGSPAAAAAYMAFFGLGTVPLMLIATLGIGAMGPLLRRKLNRVVPYLALTLGIWFLLRGMELNVPYLSPKASPSPGEVMDCR